MPMPASTAVSLSQAASKAVSAEAKAQGVDRAEIVNKALRFYLACTRRGLRGQAFTIITEDGEKIEISAPEESM